MTSAPTYGRSTSGTANSIDVDHKSNDPVAAGSDSPANYLLKLNP